MIDNADPKILAHIQKNASLPLSEISKTSWWISNSMLE